jgi:hypothetical protein
MMETHNVCYAIIKNFSDSTLAVLQVQKGAVSTAGAAAGLCRFASDHQRIHRYCHRAQYLPGNSNCMANNAPNYNTCLTLNSSLSSTSGIHSSNPGSY